MPYAANGGVSSDPLPYSIEITDEQYQQAIEGMCAGLVVLIDDGVLSMVPPPEPEVLPPTEDELRAMAIARRDQLLAVATKRMAPLQDAVDLGTVTDAEQALLLDWKRYRVSLNRIEQQPGYPGEIDWPVSPEATP